MRKHKYKSKLNGLLYIMTFFKLYYISTEMTKRCPALHRLAEKWKNELENIWTTHLGNMFRCYVVII